MRREMDSVFYARSLTFPYMADEKTPGEIIRDIRLKLGLSYREAEKRAETLSHGSISNLEKMPGSWENIKLGTLQALARAYNLSLDQLTRVAFGKEPYEVTRDAGMKAMEFMEVHPDWLKYPLYGAVAAGSDDPEPIDDDVVYIPRQQLKRRGANEDTIRTYLINGRCMVSDETRRIEKNYAPGDYVAVDYSKIPAPGDIVVAWWPDEQVMVIKRYRVERENVVLFPLAPGHVAMVLPSEDLVNIIGPVVWRGG